ncbi:3-oxoacyl-[acyl-carrier-protein] reductase FabG [Cytospora mali]|uniref:3-oxoacyl-[acyl-carrier-protein] reductase FabG n=1 Tax=Cytospora mali TaxID=578113 RepID=A0A194W8X6_CYTMA|nr:3-oxoacyl-[acyl-carrier-protein] reductase FabG [Valsa mali]
MSGNKHIVITGAARNIGRATARHLALLGHKLFLIDIDEAELSHTATSHIPDVLAEKANTTTVASSVGYKSCNLRDPVAIWNTIKSAAELLNGSIDVLVNNAGIVRAQFTGNRTMEDPSVFDEWAAYLDTNLTAPFLVSQACIPYMKLEDEKIEHPKEAVIGPEAAKTMYNQASKAGLLGLAQTMAISGAQWGIRCNAILPGYNYVRHECQEADESQGELHWAKDVTESRHRTHPTGRIGCGEDIAEAVEWLMGARFMTGQELVIDGGVSKIK